MELDARVLFPPIQSGKLLGVGPGATTSRVGKRNISFNNCTASTGHTLISLSIHIGRKSTSFTLRLPLPGAADIVGQLTNGKCPNMGVLLKVLKVIPPNCHAYLLLDDLQHLEVTERSLVLKPWQCLMEKTVEAADTGTYCLGCAYWTNRYKADEGCSFINEVIYGLEERKRPFHGGLDTLRTVITTG